MVDKVIKTYGFRKSRSVTKDIAIHGNIKPAEEIRHDHLFIYGSEVEKYLRFEASKPVYKDKIHPEYPYTVGQIVWSIRFEMARTVEDFLGRRIRLLLLDTRAAMYASKMVSEIMAEEFGYDKHWAHTQEQDFLTLANTYIIK